MCVCVQQFISSLISSFDVISLQVPVEVRDANMEKVSIVTSASLSSHSLLLFLPPLLYRKRLLKRREKT